MKRFFPRNLLYCIMLNDEKQASKRGKEENRIFFAPYTFLKANTWQTDDEMRLSHESLSDTKTDSKISRREKKPEAVINTYQKAFTFSLLPYLLMKSSS